MATRRGTGASGGILLLALLVASCLVASCTPLPSGGRPAGSPVPVPAPSGGGGVPALDAGARAWVEETLAGLSGEERVGQLLFPWIPGSYAATSSDEFRELEGWVRTEAIGGVVISIGTPLAYAARLNALQERAKVPLLVTSDFENGGPGMRIHHVYALPSLLSQGGGTSFPPTMAMGAVRDPSERRELVRAMAEVTAREARATGVHLLFAPVLDVNSNPENPIIATRSFGEDPAEVAALGVAFLEGVRAGGALATAKHFPGHGDTSIDSHLSLPSVTADRARLDSLELVPFREAIDRGIDAVMTAHVAVPGVLGPDAPPATLSPEFMTGLLREEMGFDGLLFTDALRMGAITERFGGGKAAVLALEAGADVILVPDDLSEARRALLEAIASGRVGRERVDRSVRRILEAKARVGLHRERIVPIEGVLEVVGAGAHLELADRIASRSVVLVRDRESVLPLRPDEADRVASITYARSDDLTAGRTFDAVAAAWAPGLLRLRLDERSTPAEWARAAEAAAGADRILIGVYLPPRAGAGSVAVPPELAALVADLGRRRPTAVLSFGAPYVLSAIPEVGTFLVAWGEREVSQRAAARAAFGARPISGVLPVSIPGLHRRGDGLEREEISGRGEGRIDLLDETGINTRGRRPGAGEPVREEAPPPEDPGIDAAAREIGGAGAPLRPSRPGDAGFRPEGLAALDSILEAGILDGATPGAAIAVGRGERVVRLRGYGVLSVEPDAPPASSATLYDLASLTKVVGTTTAVFQLVESGDLSLDDPVVRHLPGWDQGDPRKARVTIRDLLLHRAGLPPFRRWFLEHRGRPAFERAVAEVPLDRDPGTAAVYSDIGFMTLGLVVERAGGRPLDHLLEERVFGPLGMRETGFLPGSALGDPSLVRARVAPTEQDRSRGGMVRGVVHDENADAMGGIAGHAGLFSSARDLARFASALAVAVREGRRCISSGAGCSSAGTMGSAEGAGSASPRGFPASRTALAEWTRRPESGPEGSTRAFGWDTPSPEGSSAGSWFTAEAFGHTGFTGTSIWIDPELDLWVVLLTNRVHPTRENQKHGALRRAVHDAVVLALETPPASPREPLR